MQALRIGFFTPEYPTESNFSGGLATYLKKTALCLKAAGHEPVIFTVSEAAGRIVDEGVTVHRVRGGIGSYTLRRLAERSRFGVPARVYLNPLKLYLRFRKEHLKSRFDLLQVPNFLATGYFACARRPVPVVTRISSYEPLLREAYGFPLDRYRAELESAELRQIRSSDGVYAPSRTTSRILKIRENIDVSVINPPVQADGVGYDRDATYGTYALFFGSVGALKGCTRLLNVLPRLLDKHPDYQFVFVGPFRHDEERARYDALLAADRYRGRVRLLPEQRRAALFQLIGNARYVVLPSKIDNFPNTCIEAMLLRKVVVGTHDASFDEIITQGVNGYLVSQSDDEELRSVMDSLWTASLESLERTGEAANASLRALAPEVTIGRLVDYYRRIILTRPS